MSRFTNKNDGRQDAAWLRRQENDRKSREMRAKAIHKTRNCRCCDGSHIKQDTYNKGDE